MSSDLRALLAEVDDDSAARERLAKLARRVRVLLRDEGVEHLDDRHLGSEALEDRGELTTDDPAAENDDPPRDLGLRQQPGRVDAARRVEPRNGRPHGIRARRDDRAREAEADIPLVEGDRARVVEPSRTLEPGDVVGLEERCDAACHLLDDCGFPLVRLREVESGFAGDNAELRVDFARRVEGVRGLHPCFRRDAADPQAGSSEVCFPLDARDTGTELRGADRCRVAGRPAAEDGNVEFHGCDPSHTVLAPEPDRAEPLLWA